LCHGRCARSTGRSGEGSNIGFFEEGNSSAILVGWFLKLGQAYATIGAWDDDIASLQKGLSIADYIEHKEASDPEMDTIIKLFEKFLNNPEGVIAYRSDWTPVQVERKLQNPFILWTKACERWHRLLACVLRIKACERWHRLIAWVLNKRVSHEWNPVPKDGNVLPQLSPLAILLTADSATMKITNQKNGRMGQTIHHEGTDSRGGVAALARCVHHILQNGGNDDSLICDYFTNGNCLDVTPKHLIEMIRTAVKTLRLDMKGIDPDLVGVHSLRAKGAMTLKLND